MNTLYHIRSPYHCYQLLLCLMYINKYVYIMYTLFRKWSYNEFSFNIFFSSKNNFMPLWAKLSYFLFFLVIFIVSCLKSKEDDSLARAQWSSFLKITRNQTWHKKLPERKRYITKKGKKIKLYRIHAISKDYTSEEKRPEVMPMWMCG